MADDPWKKEERKKCRELGGERTGPTGRDLPDCKGIPLIGLEVKLYKRLVFQEEDFRQARENAAKVGVIPVLNVREKGRGGRDRVEMDWPDFVRLFRAAVLGIEANPELWELLEGEST